MPRSDERHPGTAGAVLLDGGRLASGWTRDQWAALADSMLAAVRPFTSAGHARILLPGSPGGYGRDVDALEGFARTFLLAAYRIAGEHGHDPHGLAEWYAAGLRTGTDPDSPERWVRLEEHPQAKVEAASIALALDLTRPWIWDRLDPRTQELVVDYLVPAVGDDSYPQTNWVWFRIVVQTFLRSVGGPWSETDIREDLATHDTFRRPEGWLADGAERAYDHYVGWALHTYPTLWARMSGADELAAPRRDRDVADLDRFLLDAVRLVGADGSPLVQGRSLIYRFAAAAPFWVGALAGVPSTPPGILRRAAAQVVRHFVDHDAFDDDGLLTLGWHHAWPQLAQAYSGPGSPYWAVKGLLGLSLPDDHPVWTRPEEPLPIEERDFAFAIPAPAWVVSGTHRDGVVRVVNHGTDHGREGVLTGDSPLYARFGYSTATSPLLDDRAWLEPLDQSVALVDGDGRATHRTGMTVHGVAVEDGVGIAASSWDAHWLVPDRDQERHGSGLAGTAITVGRISVVSLARGVWELRLVSVDELAHGYTTAGLRLRLGGWAVADDAPATNVDGGTASVTTESHTSQITSVLGDGTPEVVVRQDASPLRRVTAVPVLEAAVAVGEWVAVLIELSAADDLATHPVAVDFTDHHPRSVTVTWPDGRTTTSTALPIRAATAGRQHGPRSE